jgi:penicillin-binding protein 2
MMSAGIFDDRRTSEGRLIGLRVLFVSTFAMLVVVFWILQVLQNAKYEGLADSNYLRTIPLRAPRGVLFDRHGRVLVENRDSFTIAVVREGIADLDGTLRKIATATGVPEASLREAFDRRRRDPLFRPVPVIEHATFEQVAAIEVRRREMPEVIVQQVPTRSYPADRLAAHLFGYVGEIQESQLSSTEFAGLSQGAIIGQTGVERAYNQDLQGIDGDRYVVVNSRGREIDELDEVPPVDGRRLQLTIDYDLQRALEDGFRAGGFNGAAAVLDPSSGEILAMTSLPAYDPNAFAIGLDGTAWSRLINDPLRPMNNRLIQGTYSPGSTFKIVMAIAGLQERVITPSTTFYCPGYGTFYGRQFRCHRASGHGVVNLSHALEVSCNVYFYNVGDRLKIDTIHDYAARLGLTGKTGIDLPGESESLVPSTAWKQRTFGQPWYPGETISVAIGQGAVSVTPIALATMISTVANGGTLVTPHLVRAVDAGDGRGWQMKPTPAPRARIDIPRAALDAVRDGLWRVVNAAGTGGRARIQGRDVAGKTGTAQVISLQNRSLAAGKIDVRDHGWFVFFAPRDRPEVAGVIFLEHGEHGPTATPIARHVIETYFARKEGLPPPSLTPPAAAPPPVPASPASPGPVARAELPAPAPPADSR